MSLKFGEDTYRVGAKERLEESRRLLDHHYLAGGVYLAGRAVENMLRAVIWRNDIDIRTGRKSLETGHDLRELLTAVRRLGLLTSGGREDEFMAHVQLVARLWTNNMRFAGANQVERHWRKLGEITGRRTLRHAAEAFYNACVSIVRRCNKLW